MTFSFAIIDSLVRLEQNVSQTFTNVSQSEEPDTSERDAVCLGFLQRETCRIFVIEIRTDSDLSTVVECIRSHAL